MNLQERYDELDNIVRILDELACSIQDEYYKDMINDIKYEAQGELENIEDDLIREQEAEEMGMNDEFERSRLY